MRTWTSIHITYLPIPSVTFLHHVHRIPLLILLIQFPERLCADGLVFNEYDINVEKCDLPYNIDCSKKSQLREFYFFAIQWSDSILWFPLETPIPSQNCPRKNGYFAHASANVCDKFFYCVDGECIGTFSVDICCWFWVCVLGMFNAITCPAGLVFNPKTGICTWPDQAQKTGCSSEGRGAGDWGLSISCDS